MAKVPFLYGPMEMVEEYEIIVQLMGMPAVSTPLVLELCGLMVMKHGMMSGAQLNWHQTS